MSLTNWKSFFDAVPPFTDESDSVHHDWVRTPRLYLLYHVSSNWQDIQVYLRPVTINCGIAFIINHCCVLWQWSNHLFSDHKAYLYTSSCPTTLNWCTVPLLSSFFAVPMLNNMFFTWTLTNLKKEPKQRRLKSGNFVEFFCYVLLLLSGGVWHSRVLQAKLIELFLCEA